MLFRGVLLLAWFGLVAVVGTIVLWVASSRVGEGEASSYGAAWTEFTSSWGGQIVAEPPSFELSWVEQVEKTDAVLKERVTVAEPRSATLPVVAVTLSADVEHSYQEYATLSFNAFASKHADSYRVQNDTPNVGALSVRFPWPAGAASLTDYTVVVGGTPVAGPRLNDGFVLVPEVFPGDEVEVAITWATKGADAFTYRLSSFRNRILPKFSAEIRVDTDRFSLLRFGLDQRRGVEDGRSVVRIDLANVSTTQDVGLRFASQRSDLAYVRRVMAHSPGALCLFLALLATASQSARLRPSPIHVVTMATVHLTFFVFLAYMVRWWSVAVASGAALALSLGLALLFGPGAFGWRFTLRVLLPMVALFTGGFCALFALPSVAELAAFFLASVALLFVMSRSDPRQWPVLAGPTGEERPRTDLGDGP